MSNKGNVEALLAVRRAKVLIKPHGNYWHSEPKYSDPDAIHELDTSSESSGSYLEANPIAGSKSNDDPSPNPTKQEQTLRDNNGCDKEDDVLPSGGKPMEEDEISICYNDPTLTKVGSMPYRGFRVSIFKKTGGLADLFYYEPLVILDPKSVVLNRNYDEKRYEVKFKIELWNVQLESRIIKYLQKKGGLGTLDNPDVQVMPYEEVHLVEMVYDGKKSLTQLPSRPRSFLQQNESLTFEVFCTESKETAELVADPKYLVNHLALLFKSPASGHSDGAFYHGATCSVKRSNCFELNIVPDSDGAEAGLDLQENVISLIKDEKQRTEERLDEQDEKLDSEIANVVEEVDRISTDLEELKKAFNRFASTDKAAVVPLFSASKAVQLSAGNRVTFHELHIPTNEAHGSFDKDTGVFTAQTAGIYLFQFNGVSFDKVYCDVHLRVNDTVKANTFSQYSNGSTQLFNSIVISTVLELNIGDRVDIFLKNGSLFESTGVYNNRFFALLLSR